MCRSLLRPISTSTAAEIATGQCDDRLIFRSALAQAQQLELRDFSARARWHGSRIVRHHREELYVATYMCSSSPACTPRGNSATPLGTTLLLQAVWTASDGFKEREASFHEAYEDLLWHATEFLESHPMEDMDAVIAQVVPRSVGVVHDWLATLVVMGLVMAEELARPAGSGMEGEEGVEGEKGFSSATRRELFADG